MGRQPGTPNRPKRFRYSWKLRLWKRLKLWPFKENPSCMKCGRYTRSLLPLYGLEIPLSHWIKKGNVGTRELKFLIRRVPWVCYSCNQRKRGTKEGLRQYQGTRKISERVEIDDRALEALRAVRPSPRKNLTDPCQSNTQEGLLSLHWGLYGQGKAGGVLDFGKETPYNRGEENP